MNGNDDILLILSSNSVKEFPFMFSEKRQQKNMNLYDYENVGHTSESMSNQLGIINDLNSWKEEEAYEEMGEYVKHRIIGTPTNLSSMVDDTLLWTLMHEI